MTRTLRICLILLPFLGFMLGYGCYFYFGAALKAGELSWWCGSFSISGFGGSGFTDRGWSPLTRYRSFSELSWKKALAEVENSEVLHRRLRILSGNCSNEDGVGNAVSIIGKHLARLVTGPGTGVHQTY